MSLYKVVNIEEGMPLVDQAIRRVTYELGAAGRNGLKALKLIHGYGSSGTGGRIRVEVRKYLSRQKALGKIKAFVPGEQWEIFNPEAIRILNGCGVTTTASPSCCCEPGGRKTRRESKNVRDKADIFCGKAINPAPFFQAPAAVFRPSGGLLPQAFVT